jgi:hypothetical protein
LWLYTSLFLHSCMIPYPEEVQVSLQRICVARREPELLDISTLKYEVPQDRDSFVRTASLLEASHVASCLLKERRNWHSPSVSWWLTWSAKRVIQEVVNVQSSEVGGDESRETVQAVWISCCCALSSIISTSCLKKSYDCSLGGEEFSFLFSASGFRVCPGPLALNWSARTLYLASGISDCNRSNKDTSESVHKLSRGRFNVRIMLRHA